MTEEEQKEKLNDLMNKISFALKDATLAQGFEIICKRISELEKENERLQKVILEQNILNIDLMAENERLEKEAVLVWHKVTCFDKPDENGFITNDAPSVSGIIYFVKLKNGERKLLELEECDGGVFFEDYEWEDVDAWAELPEV